MIKKTFKQITEYPLTIIVGLMIFMAFFWSLFANQKDFSEKENRFLQKRPRADITSLSDGSFMETFEDYTKDQFPLREQLIKLKAVSEEVLLKCENNGIIRGQDDFLFEKKYSASSQLGKNISAIKNFADMADRRVYVAIAPTSSWIYQEKLPVGAPVLDEEAAFRELKRLVANTENAVVFDLYQALYSAKEGESEELYYRTDHHWTSLGAYRAYAFMSDEMGYIPVDVKNLNELTVENFYGTYYSKYRGIGVEADRIDFYDIPVRKYQCDNEVYDSLYDYDKLSEYDKYGAFMHGNPGYGHIDSECDANNSLIVFKDSYANSILPFLACSYEDITVIDLRYFGGSVSQVLLDRPDADILLMYNWSFVDEDNHFYKLVK